MKKRLKQNAIKIGLLILFVCQGGCAADKVTCHWRGYDIVANGYENEWQGSPQYYDKDRQVALRVTNDEEALFLCFSTSNRALKTRLLMTGLTVWIDPNGDKEQIFGIHLPGQDIKGPERGPRPGAGALRPADHRTERTENEEKPPVSEPLHDLEISYWGATGPLKMSIDEVRRTGMDIGVGQPGDGRLIYEFNIGFKAAPSLSGLKPGMVVGIGIQAGASKQDTHKRRASADRMGQGGPGDLGGPGSGGGLRTGGSGHEPEKPGPGDRGDRFEIWMQVQLADRTTG
jgi:hypothetical protein